MKYYIQIYEPWTYQRFEDYGKEYTGFSDSNKSAYDRLKVGDKLICYITKISRWCGVLEIIDKNVTNIDNIYGPDDPYIHRIKVKELVWLPFEQAIPMTEDILWKHISFTKNLSKDQLNWVGVVRRSLRILEDVDGKHFENELIKQVNSQIIYPLSDKDNRIINRKKLQMGTQELDIEIPNEEEPKISESIIIQAKLAEIGEALGLNIWIPRNDRLRVAEVWSPKSDCLLEKLPFNYDPTTIKIIENIDIIWTKKRTIIKAFEVEHTTAIYSGLLRMGDLLTLQPNLKISVYIVAPDDRGEKVKNEIMRPLFSALESGPLYETCRYISYSSINDLIENKHLNHMNASIIDDISESASEE